MLKKETIESGEITLGDLQE